MSSASEAPSNATSTPTILHPVLKADLKFLIIPLIVVLLVMILSALVYLMARRKRLQLVRENLMRLYEFDSHENEWEPLLSSGESHLSNYSSTAL